MKISIVYCTARHGGLDILEECLKHQTFKDFEVVIVDKLERGNLRAYPSNFRFIQHPPQLPNRHWALSASLNAGVRNASGELIVLLQDYIWVPPEGLQRFIERFEEEGSNIIVTGVGHQYSQPSAIDNPQGLWSVWNAFPGAPSGEPTFIDPRIEKNGFYLTCPVEWEANWSAFPKSVWQLVGGFDEEFDSGWGYDNVNFAERCQLSGAHVFIDTHNEVLCYDHIRLFGEQKHRDSSPNNQRLWHDKYRGLHKLHNPWKLNYAEEPHA